MGQHTNIANTGNKGKAYLAGIAFSFLVGFSFLGVKVSVETASIIEILAFRYDFAFIATLIAILVLRSRSESIKMSGKPLKDILMTAGFYVGFMILQTMGLFYCTSIESGIFFAVIPILTKLLARAIIGETSTGRQNLFMLLSVGAVIIMIILGSEGFSTNILGITLLLLSSCSMAASNTFMRSVRNDFSPTEISFFISLFGFVIFNATYIVSLIRETGSLTGFFRPLQETSFILAVSYLGVFCIVGTVFLMAYMLRSLKTMEATIFGNLSTAISILAGILLLREPLLVYHIVCTVFIVIGVIGVSLSGQGSGNKKAQLK